jgi:hypothetical protein
MVERAKVDADHAGSTDETRGALRAKQIAFNTSQEWQEPYQRHSPTGEKTCRTSEIRPKLRMAGEEMLESLGDLLCRPLGCSAELERRLRNLPLLFACALLTFVHPDPLATPPLRFDNFSRDRIYVWTSTRISASGADKEASTLARCEHGRSRSPPRSSCS